MWTLLLPWGHPGTAHRHLLHSWNRVLGTAGAPLQSLVFADGDLEVLPGQPADHWDCSVSAENRGRAVSSLCSGLPELLGAAPHPPLAPALPAGGDYGTGPHRGALRTVLMNLMCKE